MNTKVKEALRASIEKWDRNAKAQSPDDFRSSAEDCPLCVMFFLAHPTASCNGCPVYAATGHVTCGNTPYRDADGSRSQWKSSLRKGNEKDAAHFAQNARAHAADEAKFLRSLLPPED